MDAVNLLRPEYPRPQLMREAWQNLNGRWSFEFDPGSSGTARNLHKSTGLEEWINVPFCPESELSGIGRTDFCDSVWYQRSIAIPREWEGRRVLLHFGAVDFECEAFLDGVSVGVHYGGSSSFWFDLTRQVTPGSEHNLVVRVFDDVRSGNQPVGKQSKLYASHGCHYTRVTGIWQTVWMEAVDPAGVEHLHIVPDLDGSRFILTPTYHNTPRGYTLRARLLSDGQAVDEQTVPAGQLGPLTLNVPDARPWSPDDPFLYDIELDVINAEGQAVDSVRSYAGLRKVHVEGNRIFLNNEPIYLRLVLDQGFYPDGIWTAASDAALRRDIELSMAAGFNGARLHQKVFEERFHYWADKLGYLTWGEFADWGIGVHSMARSRPDPTVSMSILNLIDEWREVVRRDRNHPSIIAWTPLNETHAADLEMHRRYHRMVYDLTRQLDPTRPINDASGWIHVKTDLWTVHDYYQDPEKLRDQLTPDDAGVFRCRAQKEPEYDGQPYLIDEFGGIKWVPEERRGSAEGSWGYGDEPETLEQFHERLEGLVDVVLSFPHICGYCYTQLTDVEQEQNGIYNYDRTTKFDMERIAKVFGKTPESF